MYGRGKSIRVACPGNRQGEILLSPPTLLPSALYLILDTDGTLARKAKPVKCLRNCRELRSFKLNTV
eukprot:12607083-Heterocapsa_arctica.AAC.1